MSRHSRNWLVDVLIGGLVGGLIGAVVAVNFVLLVGVDQGYQANLGEIFEHSALAGVITLAILIFGPIVGVLGARRRRSLAQRDAESSV